MTSPNVKEVLRLPYKCHYCCLTPLLNYPNSLDHQHSTNITNSSTFQYDFATATISSLYPNTQFTNHESLPTLQQSFRRFTTSFPQYLNTVEVDQIRAVDFRHLSKSCNVCLDYSGHGLFSFSQVQGDEELGLKLVSSETALETPFTTKELQEQESSSNLVSNKIDEFEASSSSTTRPRLKMRHFEVSHVVKEPSSGDSYVTSKLKRRIMRYLNVLEDDYYMYFTANQACAFRIIGASYPFKSNKNLITVYDHENEGVEAMIESSKSNGARVSKAEFKWPKLKIHSKKLEEMLLANGNNNRLKMKKRVKNKGLFVFPIQSRVSGAMYSYQWMNMARENGWHVLLDASSLGPKDMDTLGLSLFQPDFLICTFYKVFGDDPSGFSCLLVKKSDLSILNESNFSSTRGFVTLIDPGHEGSSLDSQTSGRRNEKSYYEEGNVETNEFDIECKALDHVDSLGLALIGTRTRCLVNWLANALLALNHPRSDKDAQLVQIYGPKVRFDRGPGLAFNIFDWKGEKVDPMLVQKLADRNNISLGYGCLMNLWFSERYEVERNKVMDKRSKEGEMKIVKGKKREKVTNELSVVIVSLGFLTNFEDVYRVWEFVAKFLDADFVEKERWRYTALNQKTIQV